MMAKENVEDGHSTKPEDLQVEIRTEYKRRGSDEAISKHDENDANKDKRLEDKTKKEEHDVKETNVVE
ncbi:hypothetical protein KIN20_010236 [Parelaphostrongylus tenuis]|uniref:Uncharacterized protein n=1 Tax=Parelaphostrongylus tenuis TaxID=148309 RepID=A0AAD5MC99_PARTN|nr:hypothetical protein KIN20_010236 [Parelaphostrongylus tenuis]